MKKGIIFAPFLLFATNFTEIQQNIKNSSQYKIQQQFIKIAQKNILKNKATKYGSFNIEYSAIHSFTTPIAKIDIPPFIDNIQIGNKNHFIGELKYSYPIFTGYFINNSIKKAKIDLIKEKLKLKNIKRELLLLSAKLYAQIYALNAKIKALQSAQIALQTAKDKAKDLYKAGLISLADLNEIDAKYYNILAQKNSTIAQRDMLLNQLSYIINRKIEHIEGLERFKIDKPNFQNRADLQIIKQTLKLSDVAIKLAKSQKYPQVVLNVALKRETDNWILSKNEYANKDKSYIAIGLKYNIFDGGITKENIEIAKLSKISNNIFYNDYLNKIKMEYQNNTYLLKSYISNLKAIQYEIKARESYYQELKAKFNKGLIDAVDLNDAIAKVAEAKAQKAYIESQIFLIQFKLKLDGGNYN